MLRLESANRCVQIGECECILLRRNTKEANIALTKYSIGKSLGFCPLWKQVVPMDSHGAGNSAVVGWFSQRWLID